MLYNDGGDASKPERISQRQHRLLFLFSSGSACAVRPMAGPLTATNGAGGYKQHTFNDSSATWPFAVPVRTPRVSQQLAGPRRPSIRSGDNKRSYTAPKLTAASAISTKRELCCAFVRRQQGIDRLRLEYRSLPTLPKPKEIRRPAQVLSTYLRLQ